MQEELREALDDGPVGYGLVDEAGVLLAANRGLARALGLPLDAIIGEPVLRLGPNFDQRAWGAIRDEVERMGCLETETLSPRGGELRPSRLRIEVAAPGAEGGRRYLLRSEPLPPRPEHLLPSAEHWLRCATTFGRDAFWAWSQGSESVLLHPRWCEMMGIERRASAPVERLWKLFHPDDRGILRAELERLARGEIDKAELRLRVAHADGAYRWIHHRAYVVAHGTDGRPTWLMGHDLDITAQVEAEGKAVARERELRSLLERVGTAVMVFDGEGRLSRWNPAAQRLLEAAFHEMPGVVEAASFAEVLDAIDESGAPVPFDELPMRRVMRTREPVYEQVLGVVVGGKRRWGSLSVVPAFDGDGSLRDMVYTITEITETRELQEAVARRRALEQMGQVAGGVAHHVNNLLTVISASAELIEHTAPTDGRLAVEVEALRVAVERGAAMVRQLLGYAARQDRRPEVLDLGAALEASRAIAARLLPTGVRYTVRVAPGLRSVRIDPRQVDQIVGNLVANAGEALVGRGGSVEVEAREARDGSGAVFVVLAVRDDGPGMSADVARRAQEPFFTTRATPQTWGLGLSACQGIAAQNGGRLVVESRPGEGTVVEVWLPAADVAGG